MENYIDKTQQITIKEWQELVDMIGTNVATKDDLKGFATKEDLKRFATKSDLLNFATKKDMEALEQRLERKMDKLVEGNDKIVGLLTKTDTEQAATKGALKRHDEDITGLKGRVSILEQRPSTA